MKICFIFQGIMLKRATCLFSTRERLAQVGRILDQVIGHFSIFWTCFWKRFLDYSYYVHCTEKFSNFLEFSCLLTLWKTTDLEYLGPCQKSMDTVKNFLTFFSVNRIKYHCNCGHCIFQELKIKKMQAFVNREVLKWLCRNFIWFT